MVLMFSEHSLTKLYAYAHFSLIANAWVEVSEAMKQGI